MIRRIAAALLILLASAVASIAEAPKKLNVLFIVSDDLNTDLGCYGHAQVQSPNIDRLAKRGVRFDRAYCQYPVCNPSRTSFMSGRRPGTTGIIDNVTPTRTNTKEAVFLPQHFRKHGYQTIKVGKIYHTGNNFEDAASWDVDIRETGRAKSPPAEQVVKRIHKAGVMLDAADEDTWDGFVARKSVELMEKASKTDKPFFLATGFRRPHTPYIAPKKYFDLYPFEQIKPREEPVAHLRGIPPIALTYKQGEKRPSADEWRQIIASYNAAISFMDAQIGVLLDALDRLNLWDSTVVVFVSDHGYHLGEHGGLWHKMCLFEESVRVPMIVAAPGVKAGISPRLVELVDLYPTISDLSGLPLAEGLEGTSFKPLLSAPARAWKKAAFTEVSRGGTIGGKLDPKLMGRSVRTERWRYTEWDFGKQGAELYDHDSDPHEWINLATDAKHADTVKQLQALLRDIGKGVRP